LLVFIVSQLFKRILYIYLFQVNIDSRRIIYTSWKESPFRSYLHNMYHSSKRLICHRYPMYRFLFRYRSQDTIYRSHALTHHHSRAVIYCENAARESHGSICRDRRRSTPRCRVVETTLIAFKRR